MELLNQRIVFVKDPTALPRGISHVDVVEALAKNNKVVILFSHGNKYQFPKDWTLPHNVYLLEYDLTLTSIADHVYELSTLLQRHGVDLYSRHLDNTDPMPMLLAGACLTLNPGTKVAFINKPDQYINIKQEQEIVSVETDWDIFN